MSASSRLVVAPHLCVACACLVCASPPRRRRPPLIAIASVSASRRVGVDVASRWHWRPRRVASASPLVAAPPRRRPRVCVGASSPPRRRTPPIAIASVSASRRAALALASRRVGIGVGIAPRLRRCPRVCVVASSPPLVVAPSWGLCVGAPVSASACRVCIEAWGLRDWGVGGSASGVGSASGRGVCVGAWGLRRGVGSASGRGVCVGAWGLRRGVVAPSSPHPSHCDRVGVGVAPRWHWRRHRAASASPPPCLRRRIVAPPRRRRPSSPPPLVATPLLGSVSSCRRPRVCVGVSGLRRRVAASCLRRRVVAPLVGALLGSASARRPVSALARRPGVCIVVSAPPCLRRHVGSASARRCPVSASSRRRVGSVRRVGLRRSTSPPVSASSRWCPPRRRPVASRVCVEASGLRRGSGARASVSGWVCVGASGRVGGRPVSASSPLIVPPPGVCVVVSAPLYLRRVVGSASGRQCVVAPCLRRCVVASSPPLVGAPPPGVCVVMSAPPFCIVASLPPRWRPRHLTPCLRQGLGSASLHRRPPRRCPPLSVPPSSPRPVPASVRRVCVGATPRRRASSLRQRLSSPPAPSPMVTAVVIALMVVTTAPLSPSPSPCVPSRSRALAFGRARVPSSSPSGALAVALGGLAIASDVSLSHSGALGCPRRRLQVLSLSPLGGLALALCASGALTLALGASGALALALGASDALALALCTLGDLALALGASGALTLALCTSGTLALALGASDALALALGASGALALALGALGLFFFPQLQLFIFLTFLQALHKAYSSALLVAYLRS
ncbi:hypothetical protein BC826DRAFT_1111362 [Russula brevipes]|nr:hypothetical protein BC826DRAFT_1111362 [Russula brevipes]